jgi:hypothetical protein
MPLALHELHPLGKLNTTTGATIEQEHDEIRCECLFCRAAKRARSAAARLGLLDIYRRTSPSPLDLAVKSSMLSACTWVSSAYESVR